VYQKYFNDSAFDQIKYDHKQTALNLLQEDIRGLETNAYRNPLDKHDIKDEKFLRQFHVFKAFQAMQANATDVNNLLKATKFTAANTLGSTYGSIYSYLYKLYNMNANINIQSENSGIIIQRRKGINAQSVINTGLDITDSDY
jgi:hypothetical protein